MPFQSMLFIFGAILFIVGLIGQIRAKEIEVGTTNKTIRICCLIFGLVSIVLSFTLPPSQNEGDRPPTSPVVQPSDNNKPTRLPNNISVTADATYTYWEKCQTNDDYYNPKSNAQIEVLNSLLKDKSSTYKSRADAYKNLAKIQREYMNSEGALSVLNVDIELVDYFTRYRNLYRQMANLYEQYAEIYYTLSPSSEQEMIDLAWHKFKELYSELEHLNLKMNQMSDGRDVLNQKLSKKYGREFLDRKRE